MFRIGLTGGIGSGKSTVASMLASLGAVIVDADAISRRIVEPGSEALLELASVFGADIVRPDGTLDRGLLAARAFAGRTQELNAIMHPRIQAEAAALIAQAQAQGAEVVVYDMPLLFETGQESLVDLVLVVDVPEELQVARAVGMRGLEEDDVRRRMEAQIPREERLVRADEVIDNSGDLEGTAEQVRRLWAGISEQP